MPAVVAAHRRYSSKQGRTTRQSRGPFPAHDQRVTRVRSRRCDDQAPIGPHVHRHENIERGRKWIRLDAQLPQLGAQIVVTVRMVTSHSVLDAVHLEATRRIEKIMPTDIIGNDGEHPFTAVGPEDVPGRKIDFSAVVERTSVRKALAPVLGKRNEIATLSSLRIDDPQLLAAPQ